MDYSRIPPTKTAMLPRNYEIALAELRACAKRFTPEGYYLATLAMKECLETDECATWPQDLNTLASYGRMADSQSEMGRYSEMDVLARRVERARARWKAKQPD